MLAWCRSIVRFEVLRAKQRHQRERSLAERLLDDAIDAAFDEFQTKRRHDDVESWREALRGCLERVPERGQGVLRARFVDELSSLRRCARVTTCPAMQSSWPQSEQRRTASGRRSPRSCG